MLSYDERRLLHWAAREGAPLTGVFIDAGCFLGGSTLALGLGLRARMLKRPASDGRIHSFDLFKIGEERERVYFDDGYPFEVGTSTVPIYQENIASVTDLVEMHAGDINTLSRWQSPISLLFVDIAKSWVTNDTLLTRFFTQLVPGALVVQQDLVHFGHPWCALTMELLSDHFEWLGHVEFSSAVYRLRTPISSSELPTTLLDRLAEDEAVTLIERCAGRVGPPHEGYLRLAAATMVLFYGNAERARVIVAEVAADYTDATLPWISEALASVSAMADAVAHERLAR